MSEKQLIGLIILLFLFLMFVLCIFVILHCDSMFCYLRIKLLAARVFNKPRSFTLFCGIELHSNTYTCVRKLQFKHYCQIILHRIKSNLKKVYKTS